MRNINEDVCSSHSLEEIFIKSPETKDTEQQNRTAFLVPGLLADSFSYSALIRENFCLELNMKNNWYYVK